MYIDSHCHINFPDLADKLPEVFDLMAHNQVSHALCISVELEKFPEVLAIRLTGEEGLHDFLPDGLGPVELRIHLCLRCIRFWQQNARLYDA